MVGGFYRVIISFNCGQWAHHRTPQIEARLLMLCIIILFIVVYILVHIFIRFCLPLERPSFTSLSGPNTSAKDYLYFRR